MLHRTCTFLFTAAALGCAPSSLGSPRDASLRDAGLRDGGGRDAAMPRMDAAMPRTDAGSPVGLPDAASPADAGPPCLFENETIKVVVYGDSITDEHRWLYDTLFEAQLDALGDGHDYSVAIEGYPSQTAFVPGTSQPRDFATEVIARHAPDAVVLFWGMNSGCDYTAHDAAYRAMIAGFQAAGITPFLLTTIPVCSQPYRDTRTGTELAECGLGYQGDVTSDLSGWWCLEEQVQRDRALAMDPMFAVPHAPLILVDARRHLQDLILSAGCCTPAYYGLHPYFGHPDGVHMLRAGHEAVFSLAAQAVSARACPVDGP